jgi:hypothetical protein
MKRSAGKAALLCAKPRQPSKLGCTLLSFFTLEFLLGGDPPDQALLGGLLRDLRDNLVDDVESLQLRAEQVIHNDAS